MAPEKRRIGYVAQEGSLFPHLSVAGNVAFGLPRSERRDRSKVEALLAGGDPVDFLMAWVSVPDLAVHANVQRYTFLRPADQGAVINYSSGTFSADVTFDADGLVVDYPGLATRA